VKNLRRERKMNKSIQGKKNRRKGALFERKVRADLEKQGWIVDKWSNNVDLEKDRMHPAHTNRFNMRTCGFPDFICFKVIVNLKNSGELYFDVIAVECKTNGYLSKVEKEKCKWLLDNNIFSKILVASVSKENRGDIVYKEVERNE